MKLRNKKTGEIVEDTDILALLASAKNDIPIYHSLTELNEEWGDYEESERWWFIDSDGQAIEYEYPGFDKDADFARGCKKIGNHFETKGEAERAAEKLKAWKRLRDKGIRFKGWKCENQKLSVEFGFDKQAWTTETEPGLDLLFGGER